MQLFQTMLMAKHHPQTNVTKSESSILTNWNRDEMAAEISRTTFSEGIFLNAMCEFRLRFIWFVPEVRINNIPALVQMMAWRHPGDKPLSEPMMAILLTHIYASHSLTELIAMTVTMTFDTNTVMEIFTHILQGCFTGNDAITWQIKA